MIKWVHFRYSIQFNPFIATTFSIHWGTRSSHLLLVASPIFWWKVMWVDGNPPNLQMNQFLPVHMRYLARSIAWFDIRLCRERYFRLQYQCILVLYQYWKGKWRRIHSSDFRNSSTRPNQTPEAAPKAPRGFLQKICCPQSCGQKSMISR